MRLESEPSESDVSEPDSSKLDSNPIRLNPADLHPVHQNHFSFKPTNENILEPQLSHTSYKSDSSEFDSFGIVTNTIRVLCWGNSFPFHLFIEPGEHGLNKAGTRTALPLCGLNS